jgi:hypothetical protein
MNTGPWPGPAAADPGRLRAGADPRAAPIVRRGVASMRAHGLVDTVAGAGLLQVRITAAGREREQYLAERRRLWSWPGFAGRGEPPRPPS